ncbi:MAG: rhombosortase [Chromatiales bacterium]|nr:rhombosortase [Chromatiales bacterium]
MGTTRNAFVPTRPQLLALVLAGLCLALQAGGENAQELFQFQREGLAQGQLWRLFTGHFIHLGWPHALMNLAALGLLVYLLADGLEAASLLGLIVASSLAVDAGLWFLQPELEWYVGLSGVLHGLFAGLLILQWFCRRERYLWLILLLSVKLAWEGMTGPLPMTADLAGGPVITIAHLYGALGGLLGAISVILVINLAEAAKNNRSDSTDQ